MSHVVHCTLRSLSEVKFLLINTQNMPSDVHLPPQICANVPGTWAHDTMTRRILNGTINDLIHFVFYIIMSVIMYCVFLFVEILARVTIDNKEYLEENPLSQNRLDELKLSLQQHEEGEVATSSSLRPLLDSGEDVATWANIIEDIPEESRNWLDGPWIVTEFYLHRRVVEAFQYFETGFDPYKVQKRNGLFASLDATEQLAKLFMTSVKDNPLDIIELGIFTSLWGNKKDLSLFPAASPVAQSALSGNKMETLPSQESVSLSMTLQKLRNNSADYILDNHINNLLSFFERIVLDGCGHVKKSFGIVVDNAGFEIISDFFFGHALITIGELNEVEFYTKQHPTFVSGGIH